MRSSLIVILICLLLSCSDSQSQDPLNLHSKLSGKWRAKAFDGELQETWVLTTNGSMEQTGHYIEKTDTSYSAITRIEKIHTDIILFSVIKNSNPKIFKSVVNNDSTLVFENKDYKNPFRVSYQFIDNEHYQRTIMGYENDSLVTYEFNFKKIE